MTIFVNENPIQVEENVMEAHRIIAKAGISPQYTLMEDDFDGVGPHKLFGTWESVALKDGSRFTAVPAASFTASRNG
jgi:hypothetical protein